MKIVTVIFFLLALCSGFLRSADVVLDLSKSPGQIVPIKITMNVDHIILANYIPALLEKYKIKIEVIEFVPPPLTMPSEKIFREEGCDPLKKLINGFNELNKSDLDVEWEAGEKKLADIYENIKNELKKNECELKSIKDKARDVLAMQSSVIGGPFILNEGDQIAITVTRGKHIWAYSLYRPHGEWFVSYGFSFVSPLIYHQDKYFIGQDPENDQSFILKKSTRPDKWYDLEFVPSVFFWWMPAKAKKWNIGPSAGIGFNMQNPVVFAGIAVVFNYNIGVNFGLVLHKQNILKDKYDKGSKLKENLADDQLYDGRFRPNLFLSFTFRFGTNPFAASSK